MLKEGVDRRRGPLGHYVGTEGSTRRNYLRDLAVPSCALLTGSDCLISQDRFEEPVRHWSVIYLKPCVLLMSSKLHVLLAGQKGTVSVRLWPSKKRALRHTVQHTFSRNVLLTTPCLKKVLTYFCFLSVKHELISMKNGRNVTEHRVVQKSKPLPSYQKIVLKPVNEIRFIRQIKVWIKHNNIIR